MLVVTGDLPQLLIDSEEQGTPDQRYLFSGHTRFFFDIPELAVQAKDIHRGFGIINQAIYRTLRKPQGPSHLIVRFSEIRLQEQESLNVNNKELPTESLNSPPATTTYHVPRSYPDRDIVNAIAKTAARGARGIVLVGQTSNLRDRDIVVETIKRLGWLTLPAISSGLRMGAREAPVFPYWGFLESITRKGLALYRPQAVSTNAPQPTTRIPDSAVAMAGLTLCGYLFAFVYEAGIARTYGYPTPLITLSLTSAFVAAGALYGVALILFWLANASVAPLHRVPESIRWKLEGLSVILFLCLAFALLSGTRWRYWIGFFRSYSSSSRTTPCCRSFFIAAAMC